MVEQQMLINAVPADLVHIQWTLIFLLCLCVFVFVIVEIKKVIWYLRNCRRRYDKHLEDLVNRVGAMEMK